MKLFLEFGHYIVLLLIILLAAICVYETGMLDKFLKVRLANDALVSEIDYDNDGIDDYKDILIGAREFVSREPKYKSKYYSGGYPTDDYYVCTDVIWYALKNAGYDLKELMDEDIKSNKDDYNIDVIDKNIDFRRVKNIQVFLEKYTEVLTTDGNKSEEFQPGDIIVYDGHIAIVSDKINKKGIKYIIHHDGYHKYEEDGLLRKKIIGHYRWSLKTSI